MRTCPTTTPRSAISNARRWRGQKRDRQELVRWLCCRAVRPLPERSEREKRRPVHAESFPLAAIAIVGLPHTRVANPPEPAAAATAELAAVATTDPANPAKAPTGPSREGRAGPHPPKGPEPAAPRRPEPAVSPPSRCPAAPALADPSFPRHRERRRTQSRAERECPQERSGAYSHAIQAPAGPACSSSPADSRSIR